MIKFSTTFSIKEDPRSGHPFVKNKELQVQILGTFTVQPTQSVRTIAADPQYMRFFLKQKFHPYKNPPFTRT